MVGLDPSISFILQSIKLSVKRKVIIVKDFNGQAICRRVKGWKSVQGKPVKNSGGIFMIECLKKVNQATVDRALKTVTLISMQGEADAVPQPSRRLSIRLDRLLKQLKKDTAHKEIRFVKGDSATIVSKLINIPSGKICVIYRLLTPMPLSWVPGLIPTTSITKRVRVNHLTMFTTLKMAIVYLVIAGPGGDRYARSAIRSHLSRRERNFRGYVRYSGIKTEHGNFSVVCPKKAAPGSPMVVAKFDAGSDRPFSNADLKLVDEGYHVVLAHGDVAGHPKGNAISMPPTKW